MNGAFYERGVMMPAGAPPGRPHRSHGREGSTRGGSREGHTWIADTTITK